MFFRSKSILLLKNKNTLLFLDTLVSSSVPVATICKDADHAVDYSSIGSTLCSSDVTSTTILPGTDITSSFDASVLSVRKRSNSRESLFSSGK